jgi:D-alanyl-D-alanine carboxypeptidase
MGIMRYGPILLIAMVAGGGVGLAYTMLAPRKAPAVSVSIDEPQQNSAAIPGDGPDVDPGPQVVSAPPAAPALNPGQPAPALCAGDATPTILSADGRVFGHYRYEQPAPGELVAPPAGFGGGNCQQIHGDMAASLKSMIAAATKDDPAVGKAMMGVSCYRSIERQRGLFCNPAKLQERGLAGQAKWVAPPNYSEHATGLTIDFGARTVPQCHANPCFKSTRTSQWLAANASKYGFEISFPENNAQGVSYEPWHYRWVGSAKAQAVFARARAAFPSR